MRDKAVFVLALVASCLLTGAPPGLASGRPNVVSGGESSPWFDTNSNAAGSRANLKEHILSRSAVTRVEYLRSVASPVDPPQAQCPGPIVAPVLVGGFLYAITNGQLSKYDPATGSLIWRSIPDPAFTQNYKSLAISGNTVIVGASDCTTESEPGGIVFAFNATTGALDWKTFLPGGGPLDDAVIAGSYIITEGGNAAGSEAAVLNLSNGTAVWHQYGCGFSPEVVVDLVVMSNGCDTQANGSLDANNLATGALLWSLPGNWIIWRGDLSGTAGKHLFATDPAGTVVGLNPLTGQEQYSLSQAVNVLAVDNSSVYATCGSQGQDLCGYSTGTGALEWQDTQLTGTPALAAEADGILYLDYGSALNTTTGKRITRIWTSPSTALAIGDGRIAVVSDPRVLDLFGLPGY
jgi:outer membrane protein assembly factor BamB